MIRFFLGILVGFLLALALLLSIGDYLVISETPATSDAIVALAGDASEARARTAVALYRELYASVIVFSGGSDDPVSPASAEFMRRLATQAGVPSHAIVLEPRSRTTRESARSVRALLQRLDQRAILLVTSPYQQRRAALEFSDAFQGTELKFRSVTADEPEWDRTLWWLSPQARGRTLAEIVLLFLVLLER